MDGYGYDDVVEFGRAPRAVVLVSRALMSEDPAHGWPHVVRVYKLARRIASLIEESVDWLVLETAVLLHDVGRFLPGEGHHAEKSARFAEELLASIGFKGDIGAVAHAILAHSYSLGVKARTLEAMILSDADKLDALGGVGIARVFHTGCQFRRAFEESLNHIREKIIRLPGLMYLEASKTIAEERLRIVMEFMKVLEDELA